MSVYTDIQAKIELMGGAKGPKGSFNHKGGKELVIKYDTGSGIEEHHIVPFLIGKARNKADTGDDNVLLAHKYKGTTAHPGLGFRCYKVDKITLSTSPPDTRPDDTSVPPLKKLKLKRQSCVDDW